jgi:hypothetical protein
MFMKTTQTGLGFLMIPETSSMGSQKKRLFCLYQYD